MCVLVYHDPPPSLLERHLEYLSKHYRFLALGELVDALHARDWRRIPPKSVVLTFDDGHRGNADLLPLFRRYGVRPTIFICSQLVGTNRHFWFSGASDPEALKRLPNDERLVRLERETGFSPTREYPTNERQTLSRAEIEQMKEHVDFASHTRFHPLLPSCTDEECEVEIRESKAEVERLTGEPCRHFSHPNGDYSPREIEMIKAAGYVSARTMDFRWNGVTTDPFGLKAVPVLDDASVNRLVADIAGVAPLLARVRRLPPRS